MGVTDASPPTTLDFYDRWLSADFHADMEYLARGRNLKADLTNLLPGVRSVLAFALNYNQQNGAVAGQPRIARYALGRDYHKVMRGKLRRVVASIVAEHPGSGTRICVDSAPLLERELAHRAGLGWFGKNTCLIDSKLGSWFVLGFILSTVEFQPDGPSDGGCGTCRRCIDACPTGAIVKLQDRWTVDARHCISYLTIEKRGDFDAEQEQMVGEWTFGCDVCQEVCPFNAPRPSQPRRAATTQESDFVARRTFPSLADLVKIQQETWSNATEGSPVRRAGMEGIRRNAAANLKNVI